MATLRGHDAPVAAVCFSPDGKRIASITEVKDRQTQFKVWNRDGRELSSFHCENTLFGTYYLDIAFTPDGQFVASPTQRRSTNELVLWDPMTGQEGAKFHHNNRISGFAYDRTGERLVIRGQSIAMHNVEAGEKIYEFEVKRGGGMPPIAFSPDGKRFASAMQAEREPDGIVKVWDAESQAELLTLEGHSMSIFCLAYSPDGTRIATGGYDQTVRIWHAERGDELLTLKGHENTVVGVAFNPLGHQLASVSAEEVIFWDAIPDDEPDRQSEVSSVKAE